MPEMTTIPAAELANLQERLKRLADDKSFLQLTIQLMNKLSAVSGLDDTIENMLKGVIDVIGGTNASLYYLIDHVIYYADAYGEKAQLADVADPLVKHVLETREPFEHEHEFDDTKMMTPEFSKAYTWIVPLTVGPDLVGVFKLESVNIAMRRPYQQLPTFFSYAALVLKNEILGYTRLKKAYDDLAREMMVRRRAEEELRLINEALEERVAARTAELQDANEQLRRERALLSRIMETGPVGITVVNRDGQITFANPQAERVLGLTRHEITQRTYNAPEWQSTDDSGGPIRDEDLPFSRVVSTGRPVHDFQHVIAWPDGRRLCLSINGAPILSESGDVDSVVFTVEDITERKRSEKALRESEARYRRFFEDSPISLWEEDLSEEQAYFDRLRAAGVSDFRAYFESHPEAVAHCAGLIKVLDVNKATLALTRASNKDELLAGLTRIFIEESLDTFREELLALAEGRCQFESEAIRGTLSGERLHVVLRLSVMPGYETSFARVLISIQDITARVRAEEELKRHRNHLEELVRERTSELLVAKELAEAANYAKSAFLANMSHELRTPLNAILGYADILKRRALDEEVVSGLVIVQRSGEHLLTLINDILDLAKIEAGRLELAVATIHLPAFLEDIVASIRARAAAKYLHLIVDVAPGLPKWVLADETRLRQVLLNLLGNAVKFTDQGTIVLRVTRTESTGLRTESTGLRTESTGLRTEPASLDSVLSPQSSVLARFEIADTGSGIAPDQFERIFQPFEQAGDLQRRGEGTGLGLAISRQLVRLMGSDLHVESQPGRGSTFWFQVMLPLAEPVKREGQGHGRLITGYQGPRRTVLVADDIPSNRALLTAMFQPLGFTVVEAENGRQALSLAQQIRPDLILMDRWMPVLGGLEAVRQLRAVPSMREIPIIATSASVTEADRALIRAAGYDAFLPKPISLLRLSAVLEECLHLEWVYATVPDQAEVPVPPAELVPPPPAELAVLLDLVRLGDVFAVQERAAQLEQGDPRLRPFARRLRRLAGQFELEQILALLTEYLPPEQ